MEIKPSCFDKVAKVLKSKLKHLTFSGIILLDTEVTCIAYLSLHTYK